MFFRSAIKARQAPPELADGTEWTLVFHPLVRATPYKGLIASLRRRYAADRRFICGQVGPWALGLVAAGFPATLWAILNKLGNYAPYIFAVATAFLLVPGAIFFRPLFRTLRARAGTSAKKRQTRIDLYMTGAGLRGLAAVELSRYTLLSPRELRTLEWLAPAALASMSVSVRALFGLGGLPLAEAAAMAGLEFVALWWIFHRLARLAWVVEGASRVASVAFYSAASVPGLKPSASAWKLLLLDGAGVAILAAPMFLGPLVRDWRWTAGLVACALIAPFLERPLLKLCHRWTRRLLRDSAAAFDDRARMLSEEL